MPLVYRQNNSRGKFLITPNMGKTTVFTNWAIQEEALKSQEFVDRINEIMMDISDFSCTDCECCGNRWMLERNFNPLSDPSVIVHTYNNSTGDWTVNRYNYDPSECTSDLVAEYLDLQNRNRYENDLRENDTFRWSKYEVENFDECDEKSN